MRCAALQQRRDLTTAIARACEPNHPRIYNSDEGYMLEWFDMLAGVVAEYRNGGDQMVEECTCGRHR